MALAASTTKLAIGPLGTTTPTLRVDGATGATTGIFITGAAAGGGVAVAAISSGTNEAITLDAKGSGTVTINGTGTGAIALGRATTVTTGGLTITAGGLTVTAGGATLLPPAAITTTASLSAAAAGTVQTVRNSGGASYTITLPLASASSGKRFRIVVDTVLVNPIAITRSGSDGIYGSTCSGGTFTNASNSVTVTLAAGCLVGDFVDLSCDGTRWFLWGVSAIASGITYA